MRKRFLILMCHLILRNAPTALMKELGYGAEYRYAHDEPNAYAAGENYFPPELKDTQYYFPKLIEGWKFKLKKNLNVYKSKIKAHQKNAINSFFLKW